MFQKELLKIKARSGAFACFWHPLLGDADFNLRDPSLQSTLQMHGFPQVIKI